MFKAIHNCTNGLKAGETNISRDDPRIAGSVPDLLARGIIANMDGAETAKAEAAKDAEAAKAELDKVKAESLAAIKDIGKERDEARAEAENLRKDVRGMVDQATDDSKKIAELEAKLAEALKSKPADATTETEPVKPEATADQKQANGKKGK